MSKMLYIRTILGETDWKLLAIDINDPIAEKLNGTSQNIIFSDKNRVVNRPTCFCLIYFLTF